MKKYELNFSCLMDKCPSPCCGSFEGTNPDLESLNGREFFDIFLTEDDYNLLIYNGYEDLIENNKMKLNSDKSCIAFINGKCSIHEIKPTVCKAFPLYIDLFTGLCVMKGNCPGCGKLSDIKNLDEEIKSVKKMYNHWLNEI